MARTATSKSIAGRATRLTALDRAIDLARINQYTRDVLEDAARIDEFLRTGKIASRKKEA